MGWYIASLQCTLPTHSTSRLTAWIYKTTATQEDNLGLGIGESIDRLRHMTKTLNIGPLPADLPKLQAQICRRDHYDHFVFSTEPTRTTRTFGTLFRLVFAPFKSPE